MVIITGMDLKKSIDKRKKKIVERACKGKLAW